MILETGIGRIFRMTTEIKTNSEWLNFGKKILNKVTL